MCVALPASKRIPAVPLKPRGIRRARNLNSFSPLAMGRLLCHSCTRRLQAGKLLRALDDDGTADCPVEQADGSVPTARAHLMTRRKGMRPADFGCYMNAWIPLSASVIKPFLQSSCYYLDVSATALPM